MYNFFLCFSLRETTQQKVQGVVSSLRNLIKEAKVSATKFALKNMSISVALNIYFV